MPVVNGLELWLDAARAQGEELVPYDGKLATWFDASGNGRHLRQPKIDAQPTRLPVAKSAVVRFDGIDDHLRAVQQATELSKFTIFVVAIPRQNPGGFRAALAINAQGKRDFETGMTIDMGPFPTPRFSAVNVEGRGFGSWANLQKGDPPLGELYTLEAVGDERRVRLSVNRSPAGQRPRDGGPLAVDEITVGARYYTLGGGVQQVQGFGHFDIADILVYNRVLSVAETKLIHAYLDAKHDALKRQPPPTAEAEGSLLTTVKNPPPVQVLLPGFAVRELPVDLSNVNNVLYRPDGTLYALAYNGVIWQLRDTDGDGLEDKADVFWDSKGALRSPIGMDLTPPGYKHGDGIFVVGKTKCSLIVDTDADGKADKEIILVEGWKESFHNVDGLGVAYDKRDGSVFYGRGTYNFADPLLRDKQGKPQYKLTDEAGAILRVAPDFKSREIVATGIRFPVGLRFNRHGDLFATDQEGATWVPNGNPLDELLHIQKGRHYGFPPRHPKWLPNVIDEPSTYDYGPQHQSTCGFAFNDPVKPGGPVFGPPFWASDAIVTGESRGKIYRTQLVKTANGYVARNQLIACLGMLTIDCCVAPGGSLVVACHSGGPDWGSGPTGKGKLYKISYADRSHPQPVFAWANGPREVRVEFDRPVEPALLRDVVRKSKLTAGKHVRAGDRFESIWPGYAIVQLQKMTPRFDVAIRSAQLTPDRRTLVLATDTFGAAVAYALTLPGMGRPSVEKGNALRQVAEIDIDFDLTGCEASWIPAGTGPSWTGWLPHADLEAAKAMTIGSTTHDALWAAMEGPGELKLRGKLDLADMLRPAVQQGSTLDYDYPPETVTVKFESKSELRFTSAEGTVTGKTTTFLARPAKKAPLGYELSLKSLGGPTGLTVSFTTNEDARPRPMVVRRFLLPWADTDSRTLGREISITLAPELKGGSWSRGRTVFFGGKAGCSKCHSHHGRGGEIGPDLSNLHHRDYASVLRDITKPSFAINPDYLTYLVELKDGRVLPGVVRSSGDTLTIGDAKGNVVKAARADVESMSASPTSIMPEGLLKDLGPEQTRDLLTYLLSPAPQMPEYGTVKPPVARTRKEVEAVLEGAPTPALPTRPIRVVLVAGVKDHGPGEHDYPAWQRSWKELLSVADRTIVETAHDWPSSLQFQKADVLVFYQKGTWTPSRAKDLDAFLARGGGAVYVHYAVDGGPDAPGFAQRIGLAWQGGRSAFRHGPLDLGFETGARHPIGRNIDKIHFHDESYWLLVGDPKRINLLASGVEAGKRQPLFWTLENTKGRVVVSIPGHFSWTFDDPLFRVLLLRSIAWSAREPVDRFNELVTLGARVRD